VIVRNANINDLIDIYKWRNDPFSRSMFINRKLLSIDCHKTWFKNTLNDPNKKMYVGIVNGKKIGVTRFDFDKRKIFTEVSINLNPIMRGKNLSLKLLSKSISLFQKNSKTKLKATIKNKNLSSLKIFKKLGFKKINEDKKFLYFILTKKTL
tara:strand:+ start:131 stop:586 length:456 start_codon:yes stop_codon:yes gene_type:complete